MTTDLQSFDSLKRIEPYFDREARRMEYDAYFDSQYLGSYATRQAAQEALDAHVFDLLRFGLIGDADLQMNADELAEVA